MMTPILVTITQALIISILVHLIIYLCHRIIVITANTVPPARWPIVGMIPGLLLNRDRVLQYATQILQKTERTFLFRGPSLGNFNMLVTCDPPNIHYILTKNFPNYGKGPDFKKILDILGEGIFAAEFESWEYQRRIAKSLINNPTFKEFAARTTRRKAETSLVPILEHASATGAEVDLQDLFKRFTFDCTCIVVLGHDPASLSRDLPDLPHEKAFAEAEEAVLYRHVLPECSWKILSWLPEKRLSKAKQSIRQFITHCMLVKRQELDGRGDDKDDDPDILTVYLRSQEEQRGGGGRKDLSKIDISEEVWKDVTFNFLSAGKDTISAGLSWFFWLLATNPAEEAKIRQEVLTNFPIGNSEEELKKLIYLQCALCESLRLYPPVPFQHKAPVTRDVLPSGHVVEPNSRIVIPFYSMGRMESIWGKDCLEFRPERWISERGRVKIEPSFKFSTFNAGPRTCLGKELSFVKMKIVAAALLSRFRFQVAEGHPISPSNSVILHMKHGLKVKVSNYV